MTGRRKASSEPDATSGTGRRLRAAAVAVPLWAFALGCGAAHLLSSPLITKPAVDAGGLELLALKSEAEAQVFRGDLAAAHATYRRLSVAAVGRELRGRLMWDLLERANADQDRVYWILMTRLDGADRAFNLARADDGGDGTNGQDVTADPARATRVSGRR